MYIHLALLGLVFSGEAAAAVAQPPHLEKYDGTTPSKAHTLKSSTPLSAHVVASNPQPTHKSTVVISTKPQPNPADSGPNSRWFWKGPYGPVYDMHNPGPDLGNIGNEIDPAQKELWNKHLSTPQTIKTSHAKRDEAVQAQTEDSIPTPSEETKRSLGSRFASLVKRITIGGSMPPTIFHPPHPAPTPTGGPVGNVPVVYNGQPGMIYLKQKTQPTYCNDSSHTIGQNHVYLPSIYFTDVHNRPRCNQPCFLFWVNGRGHGGQFGNGNFMPVVVAGRCNDCYPWEIQAEDFVIESIAGNLSAAAGNGLWGPTLALGTNDNL